MISPRLFIVTVAALCGSTAVAAVDPIAERHAVSGLAREAGILIDRWGVPHITAQSAYDAFLAQGFNAARDRLWQITFQTDAAILTKNEDFAGKAQRTPHGPVIISLRVENCSNHTLRAWLEPRFSGIRATRGPRESLG